MTESIKNLLGTIFIGIATTIVRIIGQLAIPAGEQTILSPSIFAQNGTMPIAFTIYGIFAYSLIAALFLLYGKERAGTVSGRGCDTALPAAPCGPSTFGSLCPMWFPWIASPIL